MKLTIEITASDTLVRAIETFALAMTGGKFEQKTVAVEVEQGLGKSDAIEANLQAAEELKTLVPEKALAKAKGKGKTTKIEKVEEPTQEAEETTEEVAEEPTGETNQEPEAKPTVTIEIIRQLLRDKINIDQQAMKPKALALLKQFGAENVTTLETKHYDEFYAQLNELQ